MCGHSLTEWPRQVQFSGLHHWEKCLSCAHRKKRMRPNTRRRLAIVSALCSLFAGAASAATITGTVTNGTTKTPAAGDTVTLIALDQSMREITHTTTDAQGHFSIDAPDPG